MRDRGRVSSRRREFGASHFGLLLITAKVTSTGLSDALQPRPRHDDPGHSGTYIRAQREALPGLCVKLAGLTGVFPEDGAPATLSSSPNQQCLSWDVAWALSSLIFARSGVLSPL